MKTRTGGKEKRDDRDNAMDHLKRVRVLQRDRQKNQVPVTCPVIVRVNRYPVASAYPPAKA